MKNVITFLSQNQKLCNLLQTALKGLVVIRAENIDAVNRIVKQSGGVGAVVLHITNPNNWMIFEFLKTGYPNVPRFALLAPGESDGADEIEQKALANRYGAAAIVTEAQGIPVLASLIQSIINAPADSDTKANYLTVFGKVSREIARLQAEFIETAMRTLPQPEIGEDTQERLKRTLIDLQAIKITP
jgi:hypothetical protein